MTLRVARTLAPRTTAKPLLMVGALFVSDVVMLALAILCGFLFWSRINPAIPPLQATKLLAIGFCTAAFAAVGLYPGLGKTAVENMRSLFYGTTLAYLLFGFSLFLVKDWRIFSRGDILVAWMCSIILVPVGRQFLSARDWWGVPVMILGAGETGHMVVRSLRENRILGYRPVVCLDDDPRKAGLCEGVPVLGELSEAHFFAAEFGITYAIVAMPSMQRPRLVRLLQVWSAVFPNILVIPDLHGVASLWIQPRDLGGVLGFEIRHNLLNPVNRWLKRTVDIMVSSIGLVLAAPLLVFLGLWIWAVSRGPIFYSQEREGFKGGLIRVHKLRTMYPGAEQMLEFHLASDPTARLEWESFYKLRTDPRILPGVGHFLRKTSLDELPQLWNVLKGEMSLVGPRPFPAYHNERFHPDFRALRTQVTPGLTGIWQVTARSDGDLFAQESLDGYYIRNWSLWLDIYLLIRTFRIVLASKGAY